MAWIANTDRSHYLYGAGSWSKYYWDDDYNPGAAYVPRVGYDNCLANCTTLAYGRAIENGYPAPVTTFRNANRWHLAVNSADGWTVMDYISGMLLYPGDIIEYSENYHYNSLGNYVEDNHVGVVEAQGTNPIQSSSWWTDRDLSLTLSQISDYFQTTSVLQYRFYHATTVGTENAQSSDGNPPRYVLRYTGSEPPTPPTPTETPKITITPSAYFKTMSSAADYVDFPYSITITGIPAGETVSGGNTYPNLSRVYNTGWSYSSYTIDGVTYQTATKQQTLRYYREGVSAYATVKYMYFNLTFSNGSIHSTTPMTINVQQKESPSKLLAVLNLIRKSPCKTIIKI